MSRYETIRGYKIDSGTEKALKPDKRFDYLKPRKGSEEALEKLQQAVTEDNMLQHAERNCAGQADRYINYDNPDNLFTRPTVKEAELMCLGCPLFKLCEEYADAAKPEWGVWAGKVYGKETYDD